MLVIGGGKTALDVADFSAKEAESTTQLFRRVRPPTRSESSFHIRSGLHRGLSGQLPHSKRGFQIMTRHTSDRAVPAACRALDPFFLCVKSWCQCLCRQNLINHSSQFAHIMNCSRSRLQAHWAVPYKVFGLLPATWIAFSRIGTSFLPPYYDTAPGARLAHTVTKPLKAFWWGFTKWAITTTFGCAAHLSIASAHMVVGT